MIVASPLGPLYLTANAHALTGVYFSPRETEPSPLLAVAAQQLKEYFAGTRTVFTLPLQAEGTDFQREVWSALQTIPFGVTCSYSHIARLIGRPQAVRAVGAANGQNPHSIIVPCHRVIGANKSLTGYGGGLSRKEWLLMHELTHGQTIAVGF